MAITDDARAKELAEKIADELVASLDKSMLDEAKAVGMAASIFAAQIETFRDKYNAQVSPEIADMKLFDNAVSARINN